ncbi:MAG: hypothetical protein ACC682_16285 [Gemmatimonadota bacterium]
MNTISIIRRLTLAGSLTLAMALVATPLYAQSCTTVTVGTTSFTRCNGVTATTQRIGSTSFTTGQAYGQPINTTTINLGNMSFTTGQAGGQPINLLSQQFGSVGTTSGYVGSANVYGTTIYTPPVSTYTYGYTAPVVQPYVYIPPR